MSALRRAAERPVRRIEKPKDVRTCDPREFTSCLISISVIEDLQYLLDVPDVSDLAHLNDQLKKCGAEKRSMAVARVMLAFASRSTWTAKAFAVANCKSGKEDGVSVASGDTANVYMSRARPWLRKHGIEIRTVFGAGYQIDGANRARLQKLLTELMRGKPS